MAYSTLRLAPEQAYPAFRRTRDVRLRERYHAILLEMDGKNRSEVAPVTPDRRQVWPLQTSRSITWSIGCIIATVVLIIGDDSGLLVCAQNLRQSLFI